MSTTTAGRDRGDASTELLGDVITLPDGTVVWDTLTALGPQPPTVEDAGTATGERYDPAWGHPAGGRVANAFCPTGGGGGVDPTCSPGGGKAGGGYDPAKKPPKEVVAAVKAAVRALPAGSPEFNFAHAAVHNSGYPLSGSGRGKSAGVLAGMLLDAYAQLHRKSLGLERKIDPVLAAAGLVPHGDPPGSVVGFDGRRHRSYGPVHDGQAVEVLTRGWALPGTDGRPWPPDQQLVRPSSAALNSFCPTGPGGGVDPTCSPGKGGGASGWAGLTRTAVTPEDIRALNAHARQTLKRAKGAVAFPAELVREYTGAAYRSLNEEMRRCPPEFHCVTEPNSLLLRHLRTLLDGAAPLPKPTDVYRGLNARPATRDALLDEYAKRAGTDQVVQMPSFTSTSLDAGTAGAFSVGTSRLMFKITAKTGLYVDKVSEMPGERELLQSPSARYRVKAVHRVEGRPPLVHLEEL